MPLLTPIEELRAYALALERALFSPDLTVKYADKTRTYVSKADIRMVLQDVYSQLRAAGELDPAASRQILPVNDTGW